MPIQLRAWGAMDSEGYVDIGTGRGNNGHGPTWPFTEGCPQQIMKEPSWFAEIFHINSYPQAGYPGRHGFAVTVMTAGDLDSILTEAELGLQM